MPIRDHAAILALLFTHLTACCDGATPPVADELFSQQVAAHRESQAGLPSPDVNAVEIVGERIIAVTDAGPAAWDGMAWAPCEAPKVDHPRLPPGETRSIATAADGSTAAAVAGGLYERVDDGPWERLVVADEYGQPWTHTSVRAVTYDRGGRLWFATPAGIAVRRADGWQFFRADRLPYNDFNCAAAAAGGGVWFGTSRGALWFDGHRWSYRQGPRWLPNDDVRAIAVDDHGTAWLATAGGVGRIQTRETTLAEKAAYYEQELGTHIARTQYGFVARARLTTPGDRSTATPVDDDNDGLWTAMYGAAQCFAYAVDRSPEARRRATRAFEALRFLQTVTQEGEHSPPDGFVARSILPTSGPDPNVGRVEGDREKQRESDQMWKVVDPRWPRSADGRWWWKCDTSSDELDGHYFFYALYYDLVAESPADRDAVRVVVKRLTDHLITHRFALVDHDGAPTRWSVFGPEALNGDLRWIGERGLNSASLLSYLAVAEHVTSDPRYGEVAAQLRDDHAYHANAGSPKWQRGVGSGNQSDDEMAFMSFYNLIRLTEDPRLRDRYLLAFHSYWQLEAPERNPFFNFLYAAVGEGRSIDTTFGSHDLSPRGAWLSDSVDTLRRLPLDRLDWRHSNSHRLDVRPLAHAATTDPFSTNNADRLLRGSLADGSPVPVDERAFDHWNHDPWRLDTGGGGHTLAAGTVFLLPYHLGRSHGYIE